MFGISQFEQINIYQSITTVSGTGYIVSHDLHKNLWRSYIVYVTKWKPPEIREHAQHGTLVRGRWLSGFNPSLTLFEAQFAKCVQHTFVIYQSTANSTPGCIEENHFWSPKFCSQSNFNLWHLLLVSVLCKVLMFNHILTYRSDNFTQLVIMGCELLPNHLESVSFPKKWWCNLSRPCKKDLVNRLLEEGLGVIILFGRIL
jgi:hypothetical protein